MKALLLLVSVLCFFISTASAEECKAWKDCVSCTSHKTWSGDTCRWCPKDNLCHAKGSIFNKCTAQENKVDPSQCGMTYAYDQAAATTYLALSAVSYNDTPAACLHSVFPSMEPSYKNLEHHETDIPGLNMSAFFGVLGVVDPIRREVVIAFRGTTSGKELFWEAFFTLLTPKGPLQLTKTTVNAQTFFLAGFYSLQPFVLSYLTKYYVPGYTIVFTGHSLGGALASIAALYFSPANEGAVDPRLTTGANKLYTFGMPRVGDYDYARAHDQYVRDSWRVVHQNDLVPHVPWCDGTVVAGVRFCTASAKEPYHHGFEIFYNNNMQNPADYKQCNGIPINEDKLCSNIFPWLTFSIATHRCYFGIQVGEVCALGLDAARKVCA